MQRCVKKSFRERGRERERERERESERASEGVCAESALPLIIKYPDLHTAGWVIWITLV